MRKKLKQYLHLVEEAQDPMVEKKANADDLQVSQPRGTYPTLYMYMHSNIVIMFMLFCLCLW